MAGQTGSGKTHTLIGTESAEGRGVLPRAVEVLWRSIAVSEQQCSFAVSLTAAEIYCERIRQASRRRSCAVGHAQACQGSALGGTHGLPALPFGPESPLASTTEQTSWQSGTCPCILHFHATSYMRALLLPLARDLLDLSNDNLGVTADRVRGIILPGAAELPAAGSAQLLAGLRTALANRVVGATAMNAGDPCMDDALTDVTLTLPVTLSLFTNPELTVLQPQLTASSMGSTAQLSIAVLRRVLAVALPVAAARRAHLGGRPAAVLQAVSRGLGRQRTPRQGHPNVAAALLI